MENCTYIRSPNLDAGFDGSTALAYNIERCSSDVCQIRLDFLEFSLRGPDAAEAATEANGGQCRDTFTVAGVNI